MRRLPFGRTRAALFVVFAAATVAGCDPGLPPPTAPSSIDRELMTQLLQRLDRLIAAMEGAPLATSSSLPAQVGDPAPARTAVTPDSELLARIENLERELVRLHRGADTRAFASPPAAPPPPMQTAAVDHLDGQLEGEDKAVRHEARRSLFGASEQQVLQRLGMPSWTDVDNNRITWQYETADHELVLGFVNGVVVTIN